MTKIIVVGPQGAGKTSICNRYAYNEFTVGYKATIGVEYYVQGSVQLWDIAGQERLGAMTSVFYRGAAGALVVVDATNADSLELAQAWVKDVLKNLSVPIWILVNKADLEARLQVRQIEEFKEFRGEIKGWSAVSAKSGAGIADAIERLLYEVGKHRVEKVKEKRSDVIRLDGLEERDEYEDCCG